MRILFFTDVMGAGGKERRLTELMKGLRLTTDIEFGLVLMSDDIHYKEIFDLNIKIHYIIRRTAKDITVLPRLYKYCKDFNPSIIHCWDSMTAIYSVPVCKLLNIKLINGMVTDAPYKQNIFNFRWLRARLTFPFSDCIIGNSNIGLKAYNAPEKRSICIYNGINFDRFNRLKQKSFIYNELFGTNLSPGFIVGMVATFGKNKDHRTLIKAAINILNSYKHEVRFVLVGDGTLLQVIKDMVPSDLTDKIVFTGRRNDVESIVNIFDAGVLLTDARYHGEGISNSLLEYMSLGKPVIASRGGGTDELVLNDTNGYLITPGSENELISCILRLITNEEIAKRLGSNGFQLVKEKFNIDKMVRKYISVYYEFK